MNCSPKCIIHDCLAFKIYMSMYLHMVNIAHDELVLPQTGKSVCGPLLVNEYI